MFRTISNPWISLASRLILAAVFIYASIDKIAHPDLFAEVVHNYRILPIATENLFAMALPWIELGTGVLLLLGLLTRSAALLSAFMLIVFIAAIGAGLWRGIDITCGCFTVSSEGRQLGWLTLLEDVALLLPSFQLLLTAHPGISLDRRYLPASPLSAEPR
ncbi:MAG: DoxX family membrane protein [Acidobacteria bacterium]|nr:DoxX family membrane protein [Acidobacteriota bacterium]